MSTDHIACDQTSIFYYARNNSCGVRTGYWSLACEGGDDDDCNSDDYTKKICSDI